MKNSKIEWCDHTFNPWTGCAKVSPGCENCYAENQASRFPETMGQWGKGAPRKRTSAAYWRQPLKWNEEAGKSGTRPRVFCASMADWLDDEVPIEWLADLLKLIHQTPNLDWLLLTKRPEFWSNRIAKVSEYYDLTDEKDKVIWGKNADWYILNKPPENVWIGVSAENQPMADKRIPLLLIIPAKVRFLSCEPLIGEVDFRKIKTLMTAFNSSPYGWHNWLKKRIHWVIAGGESGSHARPMHPDWVRSLREQCQSAGVPFFFKQWGEWVTTEQMTLETRKKLHEKTLDEMAPGPWRVGKKAAGRMIDGREWNEFPVTKLEY